MKRVFILVLVLTLCFCGCAANTDPDETEMTTIEETTVSGLYVPQSSIERQTKGAVRRFDLTEQYQSVVQMGDKLLLVAQNESVRFTELIGDD